MGRSLGGGPAIYVAAEWKVRGLVLLSPFASVRKLASNFIGNFLARFIKESWDNLSRMG